MWQHTKLAVQNLHGKPYQQFLKKLPSIYKAPKKASATQYVAVLLHDIAKPLTIQTPKKDGVDRIRFTGHDTQGGQVARTMAERLKLSSVEGHNIDVDLMVWLIEHHLLAVQADVADLKETTLERYFLRNIDHGRELLTMLFGDGSATIPAKSQTKKRHVDLVLERLQKLVKMHGKKQSVIPALLDGTDIMRELKLKPGPQIGEMLALAREAQLTGRVKTKSQAIELLKKSSGL